jgi:hypothetical protein
MKRFHRRLLLLSIAPEVTCDGSTASVDPNGCPSGKAMVQPRAWAGRDAHLRNEQY